MPLRILLADDHPMISAAVGAQLRSQPGWEVCGEVVSASELLEAANTLKPDIVITDYHMPGLTEHDGNRLLGRLRRRHPEVRVVVLTMITNPLMLRSILNTRIHGLLLKDSPLSELVTAIVRVQRGFTYVGKSALNVLAQSDLRGTLTLGRDNSATNLSVRELEVLRLYLAGRSVSEIAITLCRSVKTISRQKNCAMQKLGVSNDRELFECAALQGVLLPLA